MENDEGRELEGGWGLFRGRATRESNSQKNLDPRHRFLIISVGKRKSVCWFEIFGRIFETFGRRENERLAAVVPWGIRLLLGRNDRTCCSPLSGVVPFLGSRVDHTHTHTHTRERRDFARERAEARVNRLQEVITPRNTEGNLVWVCL